MSINFGVTVYAKAMDLQLQRHSAIASNIANADTPEFRPSQVSFESELQKAAASKNSDAALGKVFGKVEIADDSVPRADGNSVDMDKQLAALSENSLVYSATATFIKSNFASLKLVITG
ncbi:MAG: flgB [Bacteriovoracaceae bacterium]|nr:flgB [Bacteriovoracaceae bacterium]